MAIVYLCSIPTLSNDYQHTIDFSSEPSQRSYFTSRVNKQVAGNIVTDTLEDKYTLACSLQDIKNVDYLFIEDNNRKRIYYFITGKKFKTNNSVIVELEIDVMQSYMFDYNLLDSFVDRCHVNRWDGNTPTNEYTDEGLSIGEYETIDIQKIADTQNNYVLCSTTPLGKVRSSGGTTGTFDGTASAKGYRFVKGYEGFSPYANYHGGESFRTGGYGITELYQEKYFRLLEPFPCSERLASSVYGTMLIAQFTDPLLARMISDGVVEENIQQNHFDAFTSLAMNGGLGAVIDSPMYAKYIANPNDPSIPVDWLTWYIKGEGGVILPGLVARRKAEADIYSKSEYELRPIAKFNEAGFYDGVVTDNNGNGFIPSEFKGDL